MGEKEYQDYIEEIAQRERGADALKRSMFIVGEKNPDPDEAARRLRLSGQTGIPADWIPEFKGEVWRRSVLNSPVARDLPRTAPKTTSWLSDPVNAGVAHDDIEPLAGIEQVIRYINAPPGELGPAHSTLGIASPSDRAMARRLGGLRGVGSAIAGGLKASPSSVSASLAEKGDIFWPEAFLRGVGLEDLADAPRYAAEFWNREATRLRGRPPKPGTLASYAGQAAESVGMSLLSAPFGASAAGSGPALTMFSLGAEGGYRKYIDAGYSPVAAGALSLSSSTMEGLTEKIGLDALYKGGKPVVKKMANFLLGELAGEEINTLYSALEGKLNLQPEMTWADLGSQMIDTLIVTGMAGPLQGAIFHPAAKMAETLQVRAQERQVHRRNQEVLTALGDSAKSSKLLSRMPEKFKEAIASFKEEGAVQDIGIPVEEWVTFWQEAGLDPARVAQEVLPDPKVYTEALATGSDVMVPLENYVAHLAGSQYHAGLLPNLRLRSGEMTSKELAAFEGNRATILKTAIDQAQEEPAQGSDRKVYEDVLAQLTRAGRAPSVAAREAALWQARYRARAQRLGVDPFELYQERKVRITAPGIEGSPEGVPEGATLSQGAVPPEGYPAEHEGWTYDGTYEGTGIHQYTDRNPDSSTYRDTIAVKAPEQLTGKIDGIRKRRELGQEGGKGKRGFIRFGPAGEVEIGLLEKADLSTFLHESGHGFLEELRGDAAREGASEQLVSDWNTISTHFGIAPGAAIPTKQHEAFARSFEAYLMEGKAPSPELASAFARFKAWLVQVYREISRLGVKLNPDVRGVFDRLVATDEEIAAAVSSQRRPAIFTTAEAAGMTEAEFAVHRKNVERAHVVAKERLERKLIGEFSRTRTALWKEERAKVRAEVEGESNQIPVFQVYHLLTRGELLDGSASPPAGPAQPVQLSRQAFVEAYGKEFVDRLPPKWFRKMTAKEGAHPDVLAEMFGFSSGEEMIRRLLEAPLRAEWIEAETDRRMKEAHGDLLTDGGIAEAVIDAVHNDETGEVLREEERALRRKALQVRPFVDQALRAAQAQKRDLRREMEASIPPEPALRELARETIARKSIAGIRPYLYAQAEAKADRKAFDAAAKGDFDTAAAEKRKERLNHHLYIEAVKAAEEVEGALDLFEKPFRSDASLAKSRDADLVNAARAILAQYGFGQADRSPLTYLEQIRKLNPDLYGDLTAAVEAATQDPKPYKELSLTEFRALRDAVANLWYLSRRTRVIEIEGQKIDRDAVLADLGAQLDEVGMPATRPGYDRAMTDWQKTKMKLLGARAALRRVESWVSAIDGKDPGPFRKYVWNPVSEGADAWREARKVYLQKFLDRVRGVEKTLTPGKIDAREIGYQFKDKTELLHAILHTGNESNKSKLLRGRGWGVIKDGSLDTSRWDAFVRRMWDEGRLTKEDYDFAQAVWDLLEELKPQAQQAHREMYGYYFSEITAEPVETPWGRYRGGYVPAIVDPYVSLDAAVRQQREEIEGQNNSFMFPTTGRGFTKGRVQQYARPLLLDLRYLPAHIDKVLRFVHIEPHVKDVGRLVFNHAFRAQLDTFDPGVAGDMLVPWLQRSARQVVELPGRSKLADDFFRGVRRRTGLQIMVANVANALQQFTGLSIAALKVKPKYLRNAMWRYVHGPSSMAEDISERSSFMRNRVTGQVFEIQKTIDDMLLNPSKYENAREFAVKHGYFLQAGTQNVVDLITWAGAYEKAVEGGETEPEAVRRADSAVRETQGSFAAEDVSSFETGSPFFRAFTQFYSYFNVQGNILGTEVVKTVRSMGWRGGAPRLFGIYFFGFLIPAFVSELIVRAMSGRLDEDDDGEVLDDVLAAFFGGQFRTAAAMIPGVGPAVVAGVNAFNDRWYDDRISTSPMVSVLESSVRAPHSVYKAIAEDGSRKRAIKDVLTAVGMATGLPVAPLGRPLGYLADVEEGRANPEDAVDFTRGLISGR